MPTNEPDSWVANPTGRDDAFAIAMPDDSMEPDIRAGDTLALSSSEPVRDGDVALVQMLGEPQGVVRRVIHMDGLLILRAAKGATSRVPVTQVARKVRVMGVVVMRMV